MFFAMLEKLRKLNELERKLKALVLSALPEVGRERSMRSCGRAPAPARGPFVDYAGHTAPVVDRQTGEIRDSASFQIPLPNLGLLTTFPFTGSGARLPRQRIVGYFFARTEESFPLTPFLGKPDPLTF